MAHGERPVVESGASTVELLDALEIYMYFRALNRENIQGKL
jgi:hypothetical protein